MPAKKSKRPAKTKPKTKAKPKPPAKRPVARRKDYGQPIDGAIAKSPHAAVVAELRAAIEKAAPDAIASLKWGMPNWSIGKVMVAAVGMHEQHVNLILAGPSTIFDDPDQRLEGEGKTGRHLKLATGTPVPKAEVARWLAAAVAHARTK